MDVSTNIIDLEYLTNPCYTVKIPEKKKIKYIVLIQKILIFIKKEFLN